MEEKTQVFLFFILVWYSSIIAGAEKYRTNHSIKLDYHSMYPDLIPINENLV